MENGWEEEQPITHEVTLAQNLSIPRILQVPFTTKPLTLLGGQGGVWLVGLGLDLYEK